MTRPRARNYLSWRRHGIICFPLLLIATLLTTNASGSETIRMQPVSDLRQEAEVMRAGKLLLVLEFAREDCPYCHKLERLFLLPMQRNADYDDKILVRSISLDDNEVVIDFAGRSVSTTEFAARYGVSLTPTLLFLNADGIEISKRLIGIWSEDFYGGFIDSRIDTARDSL